MNDDREWIASLAADRGACPKCYGNDMAGCINGDWYGLCPSENCYGLCEYEGRCDCECHATPPTGAVS